MSATGESKNVPVLREVTAEEARKGLDAMSPSLAELFARYETKRAALLPVLHAMQAKFGWLPPTLQREIAFRLDIAPAEVFRVVEFYTLFRGKPCGKYLVMICSTLSCELNGTNEVVRTICEKTGAEEHGTSPDGKFTVERVECLGWCNRGPVVQVNESDFHDMMTPEKAAELIERLKRE